MTDKNFSEYKSEYKDNKELIDFWTNLKTGYESFKKETKELKIKVDSKGNYIF
jgi:hypothetical protein